MDMAEILGALLNKKKGGGGMGSMLEDLLGGGSKKAPSSPPRREVAPPAQPQHAPRRRDDSGLEDLMREADASYRRRRGMPVEPEWQRPERRSELDDDRAQLLVCAMVNAAKADGQLDQAEQDAILGQLGEVTQDEVDFLKKQFAAPLDVREFTWNVPLGLEQEVYSFSLMAIGLDQQKEANYLKELAHGLRMGPEDCNQIHARFGAPQIFR